MERELNAKERCWLDTLLQYDFLGKKELQEQIKHSLVCPDYQKGYISLKLMVNSECSKVPFGERVPVEMIAYQPKDVPPVELLLHVINGYIDELEIYNAGGYEISGDFLLDNVKITINAGIK